MEPTEILIERGLTGVVGPNGCGKSNILEAIRWAMGESSPKSMRSSGMDDVIFSGTATRPARNLAEVTLILDNSKHGAPAAFNDEERIEVSRRIERDSGSAYRINSRDVRAKDVRLLFADAATGAHSPALVSQGRISTLISAKPKNRRAIIEEAAGITGLHARRNEAESKLRAAENNMERLSDVLIQMEEQISSLKRQARQATRYRNISGDVHRAEATQLFLRWKDLDDRAAGAKDELNGLTRQVSEATATVTKLTTIQTNLSADLPALREEEAEAAAALHRLKAARNQLEAELERTAIRKGELEARIGQIASDRLREEEISLDAKGRLEQLARESQNNNAESKDSKAEEEEARAALDRAHDAASEAENTYDELSNRLATARAQRQSLEREVALSDGRLTRLLEEEQRLVSQGVELGEADLAAEAIAGAEADMAEAEAQLNGAEERLLEAEAARLDRQSTRDSQREKLANARNQLNALETETEALNRFIGDAASSPAGPAIGDRLHVEAGLEVALGAALGDDLLAPAAGDGQTGWQARAQTSDLPDLPDGATPLGLHISGADRLAARLSQIGIIKGEPSDALLAALRPGQRLVTAGGALWRWDGYYRAAGEPAPATERMARRSRLTELDEQRDALTERLQSSEAELVESEAVVQSAMEAEREARAGRGKAERALGECRNQLSSSHRESAEHTSRRAAHGEAQRRVEQDLVEVRTQAKDTKSSLEKQSGLDEAEGQLAPLREKVEALRQELAAARARYDGLTRIREERGRRLEQIASELDAWTSRQTRAEEHLNELHERRQAAAMELGELAKVPASIEDKRKALLEKIDAAEITRSAKADKLAAAENKAQQTALVLRKAQDALASQRENKVRVETGLQGVSERKDDIEHEIRESFDCTPDVVLETAGVKKPDDLPELEYIERRLESLHRERERLGAVNLRADIELEEMKEQVSYLEREKAELEAAVARLRQGIQSLNREGRKRMRSAFEEVNAHFGDLFVTLFGGGQAQLELVDSEDPLDAGLEIMASPPGKRLQSLSLLSGGEQTLTALALIFAVFMTNPAPICVLDEADAALDDANVERFCNLLDDIVERTNTRFLIVTHNSVTMSRMDRLFGVTMAERGVSRLVSVDLGRAEELRQAG